MQLAHRWIDRNLTRLELVLALIVLLLVFGVFTRHILVIFAQAEIRMVESTIISLNSSLRYHAAVAAMRGDYNSLAQLERRSPMHFVQSLQDSLGEIDEYIDLVAETGEVPIFNQPSSYLGEFMEPDYALIDGGDWFFHAGKRTLYYKVINAAYFEDDLDEQGLIGFRTRIEYVDINNNHKFDPGPDKYLSISVIRQ